MPRYYFDVWDGKGAAYDREGVEFETLERAILEARKALHEIAADERTAVDSAVCIDLREGEVPVATILASTATVLRRR